MGLMCDVIHVCLQDNKSQYRTLTKTRTFMVDGQVVTTQSSKVVVSGEENRTREEHELW